jgi:hypothetical protein
LTIFTSSLFADPADDRLDRLEALVLNQQRRIEDLEARLVRQQAMIETLRPGPVSADSQPRIAAASTPSTHGFEPKSDGNPARQSVPATASGPPLRFQLGNATVTPFGFVDYTAYLRDKAVGSGVGTNFGAIPFDHSVNGNLREIRTTAQGTRLGLRLDSTVKEWSLLGYVEADFLGITPNNVAVSSFSDSFRLRLGFIDTRKGQVEFMAGQAFSLLTPNRKGVSPLPSDVYLGLDIDPNYNVGLVWTRSPQFRVAWHPNPVFSLAVSGETSEQYGGGINGAGSVDLPSRLAKDYNSQLNRGSAGFAVPTPRMDRIVKMAFDLKPGGRQLHLEAGGLLRSFNFYNPNTRTAFGTHGGGASVNLSYDLTRRIRLLANTFAGNGGGRYMFGQGPDVVIRGDGSPELVNSYSGLSGFEYQIVPRLLAYANYGIYYVGRRTVIDPATGGLVGYAYTGSPDSHNRSLHELAGGLSFSIFKNPEFGALLLQAQYAHFIRHPWFVSPGGPGAANNNTVYLNVRYVLPGSPPPGSSVTR